MNGNQIKNILKREGIEAKYLKARKTGPRSFKITVTSADIDNERCQSICDQISQDVYDRTGKDFFILSCYSVDAKEIWAYKNPVWVFIN